MKNSLFCYLRGLLIAALLILNACVLPCVVLMLALTTLLFPLPAWKRFCEKANQESLPPIWVRINNRILRLNTRLRWDIEGPQNESLDTHRWYFLISNHRSYADILMIDYVFSGKIPKIKFFMKRSLLWMLPIVGSACQVMGYPFLHRATKRQIKKNPTLKGKDIESIQRACDVFKRRPTSMLNFLEGTRFTEQKRVKTASPYRHLLAPNVLGFALPLNALADFNPKIINITLVYPGHAHPSLWQFISGQIQRVVIRYDVQPFTESLRGDILQDRAFRRHFRQFVNGLWREKDQLIETLKSHYENK